MKIKVRINYSIQGDEYTAIADESAGKFKKGDSVKILRQNEAEKATRIGYLEIDEDRKTKRLTKQEKTKLNVSDMSMFLTGVYGDQDYDVTGKVIGYRKTSDNDDYFLRFNNRYEVRTTKNVWDLFDIEPETRWING